MSRAGTGVLGSAAGRHVLPCVTYACRALRDLAPGEEATIAYVELGATRQQRREALTEQYMFDPEAVQGGHGSAVQTVQTAAVQAVCEEAGQGEAVQAGVRGLHPQQLAPGAYKSLRPAPATDAWVGLGGVTPLPVASSEQASMSAAAAGAKHSHNSRPAACGGSTGSEYEPGPLGVHVRVYGMCSRPPWPHDIPKDELLTQLVLVQPGSSTASVSGATWPWLGSTAAKGAKPLPGGMQARMAEPAADDVTDVLRSFAGAPNTFKGQ